MRHARAYARTHNGYLAENGQDRFLGSEKIQGKRRVEGNFVTFGVRSRTEMPKGEQVGRMTRSPSVWPSRWMMERWRGPLLRLLIWSSYSCKSRSRLAAKKYRFVDWKKRLENRR
ncbi:hypothetical protein EVAR_33169_1 [Eumeta japonica]|uniref:Uncharacterized protein n=1 Tax=Eumeta variegata TaxID=151549 RepID=A0A4C1W4N3_EUMVA|nr:hypothetical protein EVAR_33169_1 [Eumeta japonica]